MGFSRTFFVSNAGKIHLLLLGELQQSLCIGRWASPGYAHLERPLMRIVHATPTNS